MTMHCLPSSSGPGALRGLSSGSLLQRTDKISSVDAFDAPVNAGNWIAFKSRCPFVDINANPISTSDNRVYMSRADRKRSSRDDVRRYEEAGIDRVVVLPWRRGREADEGLARLADAVLSSE